MKFYAGIGSRRECPVSLGRMMSQIALKLTLNGYVLRSGGAQGCDHFFEEGVSDPAMKRIFRAREATPQAIALASIFHPNWDACDEYSRKLLGRNAMVILGENLDEPVKFVICWTRDGKASGGTGHAISIAQSRDIPVFNLYFQETMDRFRNFVGSPVEKLDLL